MIPSGCIFMDRVGPTAAAAPSPPPILLRGAFDVCSTSIAGYLYVRM